LDVETCRAGAGHCRRGELCKVSEVCVLLTGDGREDRERKRLVGQKRRRRRLGGY